MTIANDPEGRYISTPTGYLMVLRAGDNVFAQLERLARRAVTQRQFHWLGLRARHLRVLGRVEEGLRSAQVPRRGDGKHGGQCRVEARRALHPCSRRRRRQGLPRYGGHLLDLEVSTGSMEITLLRHEKRLERVLESCTGANVLGL